MVGAGDERIREVEVVDPHHAIRAGNITVAVVRCDESCPRSHFWRQVNHDQ